MRPFNQTMQSQRLDVQALGLALLAGAALLGLAWGGWALLGRGPADAAEPERADADEGRRAGTRSRDRVRHGDDDY